MRKKRIADVPEAWQLGGGAVTVLAQLKEEEKSKPEEISNHGMTASSVGELGNIVKVV